MAHRWLRKLRLITLTPLVLILLVAIACGAAATATPAPAGQTAPKAAPAGEAKGAPPVPAAKATPVPTPAPKVTKPTGQLRIAYTSLGSDGIHPKASNINAGGKDVQTMLYDVIIGSDAQGSFSTQTGLASAWTTAPDARSHTVNLRQGIKFHNGAEVTAEDAKFSIEEVLEKDSQTSFIRELEPLLGNLEVSDRYTLKINCAKPCLFALWIFSGVRGTEGMVVPKAHYEQVTEDQFAKSPVGSGPYRFGAQVLGASIQVEAIDAPHFRGGVPKYKTITFLGVPEETTRVAMLKSGAAEIIDASRERVASLQADKFNIFYKEKADLLGAYFFQQWEESSPFRDIRVRQALNLAVNREGILKNIFSGRGGMTFYPMGSYGIPSGLDTTRMTYPYDPERARTLLKEAGHGPGNPVEIKLAIYPFGGIAEFPRMIEAMGADFDAIGVKVKFQPTEYGTLRNLRGAKQLGGWVGPWATTNRAAPAEIISILRALYYSKAPLTTYAHPGFDALMDAAFTSLDVEKVKGLIVEMHRWLYDNYAAGIPLFEVDTPFATVPAITTWDLGKDSYDKNLDNLIFPTR